MNRVYCIGTAIIAVFTIGTAVPGTPNEANSAETVRPNFVVLFCDNLGYGDTEPFGSKVNRTPNLSRMAREGRVFTDFYVTAGVCTPSRASLLTGCYPRRVNRHESDVMSCDRWPVCNSNLPASKLSVLWPASSKGLHPDEITVAEVLKQRGYATTCIGKWHLGDQTPFLPTRQGFDSYLGIPYSEGMMAHWDDVCPALPLMRDEEVIEAPVDCNLLTRRYTNRAVDYIKENKDRPFFLYLAHAMPGSIPDGFASEDFKGKSEGGPWGDKVEEIDWSTGRILDTLEEVGIEKRTLVIWTSDNGAGPIKPEGRGSNFPLAGRGYTTAEAGMRVPCIMSWPGTIPADTTCGEVATALDVLPTFAALAAAPVPIDRVIDGKDIRPLILGAPSAKSPHKAFFYYQMGQLQAVRSGRWKLYLPLGDKRTSPFRTVGKTPARLFDLKADLSETNDLAEDRPDVVRRLTEFAEKAREDLGDEGRAGRGQRPAGTVKDPRPQRLTDAVILQNDYVACQISPDGRNIGFVCRKSGRQYGAEPGTRPFLSLKKGSECHQPGSCVYGDGKITFEFPTVGATVVLKVVTEDRYFVFEVLSVSDPQVEEIRLVDLAVTASKYVSVMSGVATDGEFAACLRALNLQVRGQIAERPAVLAGSCYKKYGLVGAKFALVGCPHAELRDVLKEVVRNEGLPYSPLGGPWALDAEENRGSYLFAYVTEENVDEWIRLAKLGGLTHMHLNGWFQSLGHYQPRESAFPNGLDGLKATIDKIHAAGLKAGMHTLTNCIHAHDAWITPVPDPRLATDATFTLAAPLDSTSDVVITKEPPGDLDTVWGYGSRGNVVRLGNELIQYSDLAHTPPYGFTGCKRGALGTQSAAHKKGALVGHLYVRWSYFHPDESTTLVDDIAAAIAHVYDTCGFDMIYMDGITEDVHGGWHGAAKIRRTIFQKIKRPVLVEASCWDYHSWPFHSRLGAWDHPKQGLKRFIDLHCRLDEPDIDGRVTQRHVESTLLPTQLGWWVIFGPSRDHRGEFPEEFEYLCAKALGHDSPVSFQGIRVGATPGNARRDEYLAMAARYEKLRLSNYFSEPVKKRLRQPGDEIRLVESSKGVWQFLPTDYHVHKVTEADDGSRTWTVDNRFSPQPVKLRIEALYSVEPYESDDAVVLADFSSEGEFPNCVAAQGITNELAPSGEQVRIGKVSGCYSARNQTDSRRGAWARARKTFVPEADIEHCDALGVWIHGDGKGELLNFQLTNARQRSLVYDDHHVSVDFTGWRYCEFLLRERDAHRHSHYVWPYAGHSTIYRRPLKRKFIDQLNVYFNDLPPQDSATCYLSPIKALRTKAVTLHNPAVEIGPHRIVFPTDLPSGSYLEFESESDCRLYDERGKPIGRVRPQGKRPLMAAGDNRVTWTCEGLEGYRSRANVTLISHGMPFGGEHP